MADKRKADHDDEELIDLNKLSQRELIILLHSDVKELKDEVKELKDTQNTMAIELNTMKTKSTMWGAVAGTVVGIGIAVIEAFRR